MPGMMVPEKPETAIEPGWMMVFSCAWAGFASHRLVANASAPLLAVNIPRIAEKRGPAEDTAVRIAQWRMRLLPVVAGKAAATRAPERASRAIPALSPLITRCPPLTSATICRGFRCVNGITESRADADPSWRPDLPPASSDPREPQHIVSMVMGCSCSEVPHHAAPRQSVAGAPGKVHRRRESPASLRQSLRIGFRRFDFSVNLFAIAHDQATGARRLQRP